MQALGRQIVVEYYNCNPEKLNDTVLIKRAMREAANAAQLRRNFNGSPLIYVPEVPFDPARFAEDVRRVYGRLGRCLVAVSEGVADASGVPVAVALAEKLGRKVERDSHGNVQLSGSAVLGDFLAEFVRGRFGKKKVRVRADTYGYLQRSFAGYASPVDQAEARLAGRKAVEFATSGERAGSVAFRRLKGSGYRIQCFRAELKDVARRTRPLPRKYVNRAGNNITASFRAYVEPLVGPLPVTGKL